jgi:hypothetical protein
MPRKPKISDLVLDSKLETSFLSDGNHVSHTYITSGRKLRHRAVKNEETWRRKKRLGTGTYGTVWLEEFVPEAYAEGRFRAVKEIAKGFDSSVSDADYYRELEAIAKFSHDKVAIQSPS